MTREEELRKELADIEAARKQAEKQKREEWKQRLKVRDFPGIDGVKISFAENYEQSNVSPENVITLLTSKGNHIVVHHTFSGYVEAVNPKYSFPLTEDDIEVIDSIDKGRPGFVVCDENGGNALFALAFYPDDQELVVFNVSEVHAW